MRFLGPLSQLSRGRSITAIIMAAGMLLSVSVCGWVLHRTWVEAEGTAERQAVNLAALAAQDIARTVTQYDLSLQAVGRGMELPGLWDLPPELRQLVLFDRAGGAAQFGFLNVLDASGNVVADMQAKTPRPANHGHRDYFQALRRDTQEQLFIGRPVLTGPGQPAMLPMARRRTSADGAFHGVIVGSMRLATIQDLFTSANLGRNGSIALTRADGVILMRLPFNPDDIGRFASVDSVPPPLPTFNRAATWTVDSDKMRRLVVQRPVGELPLIVTVGLADADIHAGWWPLAIALTTLPLVLAAVSAVAILQAARLSRARIRAEAAVERAKAEQVRVTTTVSHELRSPLTSLLCYAEMLGEADLPPVESGRVTALRNAGEHLRTVVDRLIELTRSEAELERPRPSPTDLDELVEQSRRLVEPLANRRALALASSIAPELPRNVLLDGALVRMVLNNLLTNALKYTDKGHVDLRVSGSPRCLRFEVADTGPGIRRTKRSRLFKAFDRLDADETTPGSGYGLSVAHRMVANMGGAIEYADNPGGGSVFWFEVPVSVSPAPAPAPIKPAAPARSAGYRILLVEDDPANSDVATTCLRGAGHQIAHAANGVEGLHMATSEEFDLIVTDMRMPEMNGLEMARRIRTLNGRRGQAPILLLSADMQVSRLPAYESAQVTLLLPKPYGSAQLLGAVQAAVAAASPIPVRPAPQTTTHIARPDATTHTVRPESGTHIAGPESATRTARPESATRVPPSASPTEPSEPALFDPSMLEELAAAIDPEDLASHLRTLCDRIETLLGYLARDDEQAYQELCDLAHDTGSSAGLLGFTALSVALRRFQQATYAEKAEAADFAGIAHATLDVLHRRLDETAASPGQAHPATSAG